MEPTQPKLETTNPAFWFSARVYKTHRMLFGAAVMAWVAAAALIPGNWSMFWPVIAWSIAFLIHFLVFKGLHIDEKWVNERVNRINEEAKDISHIKAIRDDYTSVDRLRRPKRDEDLRGQSVQSS